MANREPLPHHIGIDSTSCNIPPFTQQRGSPLGTGVSNVDNLIVFDTSLSTTTPLVPPRIGVPRFVLGLTPPDLLTPLRRLGSRDLHTDASSEADMSDYLSCTPEDCQECLQNSALLAQFPFNFLTYVLLSYFVHLHCANIHIHLPFFSFLMTLQTSNKARPDKAVYWHHSKCGKRYWSR